MDKQKEIIKEIIIDAKDCVAGRVASFAAKKALLGNRIIILNCNEIMILGRKKNILKHYQEKFVLGHGGQKGPHFSRVPDRLMRRIVRGMLPWKRTLGREAFKRVICFKDIPEKYKNKDKEKEKEMIVVAKADAINFLKLKRLCNLLGKQ